MILLGASFSRMLCSPGASQWPKVYIFEREFVLTIRGPLPVNSLNSLSHSSLIAL